jgi:hypothetical protein
MATFTKFHSFIQRLGNKEIDLDTDVFKAYLSNVAPNAATHTDKSHITEISGGNGYSTGGVTLTAVTWAETGTDTGIWRWSAADISWTASGGDIAAHRYLIIYDDTHANDALVGYVDRGSSAVISNGNTRTWDIGTNGLLQVS